MEGMPFVHSQFSQQANDISAPHHPLNQRLSNESFTRPFNCSPYPLNNNTMPPSNLYRSDIVHSHPSYECNIGESSNDSASNHTFRSSQSDLDTNCAIINQHSQGECFENEQIPQGPYSPELGASDNPHYFSVNQMLYEAHVSRMRRCIDQENL